MSIHARHPRHIHSPIWPMCAAIENYIIIQIHLDWSDSIEISMKWRANGIRNNSTANRLVVHVYRSGRPFEKYFSSSASTHSAAIKHSIHTTIVCTLNAENHARTHAISPESRMWCALVNAWNTWTRQTSKREKFNGRMDFLLDLWHATIISTSDFLALLIILWFSYHKLSGKI